MGERIKIWTDHWIPQEPSRKVITPRGNTLLCTVNELINPETGGWDEDLVRHIFFSVDVDRILKIPLSLHQQEDFVAWQYTRSGTFSVRSAYYVEFDHQFRCHYASLNSPRSA